MNMRHLCCFVAVAEELHFGRAARRLHIEQSPLSRIIRKLEENVGTPLLDRTSRAVRLTPAGRVLLDEARRLLRVCDQVRHRPRAASGRQRESLRVALADGVASARLSTLLTLCRSEAPEVGIRLFDVPLSHVAAGIRDDLYDVGLVVADNNEADIVSLPVWQDPLVVTLPTRHPLLVYKKISLAQVMNFPLILCHPQICEGCSQYVEHLIDKIESNPVVAEYVTTHALMVTLVAAGYGLGFSTPAHLPSCQRANVVARQLTCPRAMLTTYLLRSKQESTKNLTDFIERAGRVGETPVNTIVPP
jgi:DNA-binding transcriptional LysR family regulator